jgi:hypothetical protein
VRRLAIISAWILGLNVGYWVSSWFAGEGAGLPMSAAGSGSVEMNVMYEDY